MTRPSVICSPTNASVANFVYRPTSAMKIAPAPPSRLAPATSWGSNPSDLLRIARSEEAPGTEDQHQHQHEERERVLQLEGRRDAVAGQHQRRADRLQEPEQHPPEGGPRDAADPAQD